MITLRPHATLAPAALAGLDALRVITANHRSTGFEGLARVSLPASAREALVRRVREAGIEAVLLCTCNRTELYWYARGADEDAVVRAALQAVTPLGSGAVTDFTRIDGLDAARHLFRVTAGLESLMLGEAEVLGQVRGAIEAAEQAGNAGCFLPSLFHAAVRFGGRARSETRIGQGALSVASAAVQHLSRHYPDLTERTVVVLGAGVTGLKAARHLQAEHVKRLVLLNRTVERAREGAAEVGAEAGSLEDLPRWLAEADAVVAAVSVNAPIVTAATLRAACPAGRATPLTLVDLSIPRAMDPDCNTVEEVTLHDLSGLERIVADNHALREREIPRVESLLERELEIFTSQARESAARPLVSELRRRAEEIRQEELRPLLQDGTMDPEAIERATRRIVDWILQGPSAALRRGDLALDPQHVHYLRAIFGLAEADGGPEGGAHGHP